tara:strand:- start:4739 stop:5317 length:579 start_codon:yes stop_codon:yes gene_type:complete
MLGCSSLKDVSKKKGMNTIKDRFQTFVKKYYTSDLKLKPGMNDVVHKYLQKENIVPANIVSFATLVYEISKTLDLPLQATSNDKNTLFSTKQSGQTLSYRIEAGDSRFDRLVKNVMKMKEEDKISHLLMDWILSSENFRLESMKPFGLYLGLSFMYMIGPPREKAAVNSNDDNNYGEDDSGEEYDSGGDDAW